MSPRPIAQPSFRLRGVPASASVRRELRLMSGTVPPLAPCDIESSHAHQVTQRAPFRRIDVLGHDRVEDTLMRPGDL